MRGIGLGIVSLALGAVLAGCGSNAPCPVSEDMVENARSTLNEAQQTAENVVDRKQELESQIADKQARIRELENRKAAIQSELDELLGG